MRWPSSPSPFVVDDPHRRTKPVGLIYGRHHARRAPSDTALRRLTDRSLAAIAALVEPVAFGPGEALVREGEPGERFIVLLEGTAVVVRDGVELRRLGPGDHLGEIALFTRRPRTATVTATTPIAGLAVGREAFSRLVETAPVVRVDIVTALADRSESRPRRPGLTPGALGGALDSRSGQTPGPGSER